MSNKNKGQIDKTKVCINSNPHIRTRLLEEILGDTLESSLLLQGRIDIAYDDNYRETKPELRLLFNLGTPNTPDRNVQWLLINTMHEASKLINTDFNMKYIDTFFKLVGRKYGKNITKSISISELTLRSCWSKEPIPEDMLKDKEKLEILAIIGNKTFKNFYIFMVDYLSSLLKTWLPDQENLESYVFAEVADKSQLLSMYQIKEVEPFIEDIILILSQQDELRELLVSTILYIGPECCNKSLMEQISNSLKIDKNNLVITLNGGDINSIKYTTAIKTSNYNVLFTTNTEIQTSVGQLLFRIVSTNSNIYKTLYVELESSVNEKTEKALGELMVADVNKCVCDNVVSLPKFEVSLDLINSREPMLEQNIFKSIDIGKQPADIKSITENEVNIQEIVNTISERGASYIGPKNIALSFGHKAKPARLREFTQKDLYDFCMDCTNMPKSLDQVDSLTVKMDKTIDEVLSGNIKVLLQRLDNPKSQLVDSAKINIGNKIQKEIENINQNQDDDSEFVKNINEIMRNSSNSLKNCIENYFSNLNQSNKSDLIDLLTGNISDKFYTVYNEQVCNSIINGDISVRIDKIDSAMVDEITKKELLKYYNNYILERASKVKESFDEKNLNNLVLSLINQIM